MKAQVKTNYQIIEEKDYEAFIDLDFEAYAKENELEIEDKNDLQNTLEDYILGLNTVFVSPDHISIVNEYSEEREILNMEELIEFYSYLIVAPPIKTCYDNAPRNSNFCPTCGTKLK